ncbi:AAA family ATPase [Amycolatopsis vancoresmycina]|uniref:Shy8-kinase n=1 Tax=Amycolatopsis vancoresmycina DSM 44592 TaxID=1292037 RepID=R1FUD0_9PSEU|nr:AAA family ATPase [Amycolatopsis vancoresmycina]EOD63002.1 Shy8-kinase [Amycolatopsis vancoresmycina DSM 44592]
MSPLLIVLGGLPATGKTTVATDLARRTGFAFLRVDTIEQAILRTGPLGPPLGPVGYVVAREVAADVLGTGVSVIAECVNPLSVTRDAWRATGLGAGARVLEVEIVCSDPAEHRRRAETRDPGVPGLVPPTWAEITAREYEPWNRDRLVVDTAGRPVGEAVSAIAAAIGGPQF